MKLPSEHINANDDCASAYDIYYTIWGCYDNKVCGQTEEAN
jgi:hypothetical protein